MKNRDKVIDKLFDIFYVLKNNNSLQISARIAAIYFVSGAILISVSGHMTLYFINSHMLLAKTTLYLGLVYDFLTSVLGFLIINRYLKRVKKSEEQALENLREVKRINKVLETTYRDLTLSKLELRDKYDQLKEQEERIRVSEERFKIAAEGSNDIVWDIDFVHKTTYISDRVIEVLGFEIGDIEIELEVLKEKIHYEDIGELVRAANEHLAGDTPVFQYGFRMFTKKGSIKWFIAKGIVMRDIAGRPLRFSGSVSDITKIKEKEAEIHKNYQELEHIYRQLYEAKEEVTAQNQQLKISENNYRTVIEATNDGIVEYDMLTKKISLSQRGLELLGYGPTEEFIGDLSTDLVHYDDLKAIREFVIDHRNHIDGRFEREMRLKLKSGGYKWFLIRANTIKDENGRSLRVLGAMTDIHALKTYQHELHQLAYHDRLTGLYNRAMLYYDLESNIGANPEAHQALIFIDMDNFKIINDTMGHVYGDRMIIQVSERLTELLGGTHSIYRLGGDEFIVYIKGYSGVEEVISYADNILESFQKIFSIEGTLLHCNVSLGIALYPEDVQSPNELLNCADLAMFKAKETGKNRYVFYNKSMQEVFKRRLLIEKNLRSALTNGEFKLNYQPQFDLKQGKITGFEALLRWNNEQLGSVRPDEFIEIAEETHLIIPIGDWVLRKSGSFIKKLHESGFKDLRVSINISVLQLLQEDFTDSVINIINRLNVDPRAIELEITESILIESYEDVITKLNRLRDVGFGIAMDDFGKGYSSLSGLKHLPINTLKIDKIFIDSIGEDQNNKNITENIVLMGRKMGMTVLAEGVETNEQLEYLAKHECHMIQGYIISKPVPEDNVTELLEKWR